MNRNIRYIIFIILGVGFYLLWNYGGDKLYSKFVVVGIEHFVTKISEIDKVSLKYIQRDHQMYIACKYPKGEVGVSTENNLPIVLLLAWQFSLFFDKRITSKRAFRLFTVNFLIFYFLQITYPLLLLSESGFMFIVRQIFSFLVFFIILKDTFLIRLTASKVHLKDIKKQGESTVK